MPGSKLSAPQEIRFRWYRQVEKYGKTVDEVCNIFGMSRKTYYKWYNKDHGYGSNRHISHELHPQLKLTSKVRCFIYDAKLKYNYGPKKMKLHVKEKLNVDISTTVIYRYYKKKKLIKKPQRKQPWYCPMKEPFSAKQPGENVQLDVKYVPSEEEPGTWNYQYRFTDTYTNLQYAIDCYSRNALTSVVALRKAKRFFPFEIKGLQTDNGGEFRGGFASHVKNTGINQRFIPKRSAPWNGKVERANRSVDDEYYLNPNKPFKNLREYVHWYNHERYHLGKDMNGLTPIQKFNQYLSSVESKVSPLTVN